jgi:putative FmdB family regulatory protein
MPIYEYQCDGCGEISEKIFSIHDDHKTITCAYCYSQAKKIISSRGGVQIDTPSWLDDPMVQGALRDTDSRLSRPIETRGQLKSLMKKQGIAEAPKAGPRWV